ncbi:MAG: CtsR family transcriptional regulator [Acidaminococcaceae bacterium]|jgi:transcriptional regulator CtsR|nr:CtsR family transcriptional regulator [Acidaminococcaceae bacterium]
MKNIADIIEHYIVTQLLSEDDNELQMSRSDVASRVGCAPSQVSYVLNTRFTLDRGYLVQSKRGSGGFIRIMRVLPLEKKPEAEPSVDEYLEYWYQTKALTAREFVMLKYLFSRLNLEEEDKLALLQKTLHEMINVS